MQLRITECDKIEVSQQQPVVAGPREVVLEVSYCAICRTDAKIWREGHRDLAFPRVVGHELVGRSLKDGKRYVVWPGIVCDSCRYCRMGRENLCESMQIIGFHVDGGFARRVVVPESSLIDVNIEVEERLLTFTEPIACVLNSFEQLFPKEGERLLVLGGGVLGMLAALIGGEMGCQVTVIERSAEKIARLAAFADHHGLTLVKETTDADFDLAINCCDSPMAFAQAISKLRKGGRLGFFSGLQKREELESGLLNLIHYRELEIYGSYGPRRDHMEQALQGINQWQKALAMLVEKVISLQEAPAVFPQVLAGEVMKYIVDCRGPQTESSLSTPVAGQEAGEHRTRASLGDFLENLVASIPTVNAALVPAAQRKVDLKTKPLGALGRIEQLAVQLSVIQKCLDPRVEQKRLMVFAGDHGVVDEGVSAVPAKVTVQMVQNFLKGGAAINVFCRQYGIDLRVVDMGVNGDFTGETRLIHKKVAHGTANFAVRSAMSREHAILAIERGAQAFLELHETSPCQLVGMGEMGIGNTSSASAVICGATGLSAKMVAGRGTGIDDVGLERKIEVIDRALALHRPSPDDGLELLAKLGGYELGGICGAVLAAASQGCCVVLDGIISTAGGLLAYLLCPAIQGYLVAGHRSVEAGQLAALRIMGLSPVVDLDFRLGEGTGAAVTMNLVDLACAMMRDMASFEEAGVDSGGIV